MRFNQFSNPPQHPRSMRRCSPRQRRSAKLLRAAATAASMSARLAAATVPSTEPSAGLRVSNREPPLAGRAAAVNQQVMRIS